MFSTFQLLDFLSFENSANFLYRLIYLMRRVLILWFLCLDFPASVFADIYLEIMYTDWNHLIFFFTNIVSVEGFRGDSDGKEAACSTEELGLILGWIKSLGGGHGNPLQYSCLEDPVDRGAWQATVHGIPESDTTEWLSTTLSVDGYLMWSHIIWYHLLTFPFW